MTDQELLDYLDKHQEAKELMLQGIDDFNNGNLEAALSAFEESSKINPTAIPNLLYHSLCCFSLIQSRAESSSEGIAHPESRRHIHKMISNLESAINLIRTMEFRTNRF